MARISVRSRTAPFVSTATHPSAVKIEPLTSPRSQRHTRWIVEVLDDHEPGSTGSSRTCSHRAGGGIRPPSAALRIVAVAA